MYYFIIMTKLLHFLQLHFDDKVITFESIVSEEMSQLCHKFVTNLYLFSGLLLFTYFCKHCGVPSQVQAK